jgi:hypothetical protein
MPGQSTYGTLTTLDTLATTQQTIVEFGEDRAFQAIATALAAHNEIMADILSGLVETSADRQRRYGGPAAMAMDPVDQMGRADAQKVTAGVTVGFPLRKYQASLQWNRDYFEVTTAQELAAQFQAARDADILAVTRELKRAIFTPTNSSFVDVLIDSVTLPVKAFVNADSAALPVGPNGETFNGATHTHYLGTASFVASDLSALIFTVIEHYGRGNPVVLINRAQEAAVRAFTGFNPYFDMRIQPADTTQRAVGSLDQTNLYNRAIGVFDAGSGAAEVWVKPWVPANYICCYLRGVAVPLVRRIRNAARGALRLVADNENFPLRAQTLEREFGVGVWQRTAAAVLYTAGTPYVAPTIT